MSEEQKKPEYIAENESQEADTIFGGTPAAAPKAAPKKGMSKNMGILIASIAALVVVGGSLTAVLLAKHNTPGTAEESSATESAQESIMLNEADALNVEAIDIQSKTPFHVTRTFRGREDAAAVYTIDGYEDLTLDADLLRTLANNGCTLEAVSLVEENASDLSKYGLGDTAAAVTLQYEDGTDFQFRVGDKSPMENAKTYVAVGSNVYLVRTSLVSNYQKEPVQFLSTTVLAKPADDAYPIVKALRIQRKDLDWDIYMEYDYENADDDTAGGTAATHVMREPIFSYLNVEKSSDITNGMFGLAAQEIAVVHPSESDLKKCGLDDPFCTVTMDTDDDKSYTLTIGNSYQTESGDTLYYAQLEGVNAIFGVTAENAAWINVQPGDITSSNIFVTNVWSIESLDVKDKTHEFHFEGTGTKAEDYVVTKNGEACDTERFRLLYRFLLYIYGEEFYIGELPEGEPDAEVHLKNQNGREEYTISFYRVSDLRTIVVRDGIPSYCIRSSCLDTLAYNMEHFDDASVEFKTTWQ